MRVTPMGWFARLSSTVAGYGLRLGQRAGQAGVHLVRVFVLPAVLAVLFVASQARADNVSRAVKVTADGYPSLTHTYLSVVNAQQAGTGFHVSLSSASVAPAAMPAARREIRGILKACPSLGSVGTTRVVAAGYVKQSMSPTPALAFFLDPPGQHQGVSSQPLPTGVHAPRLDWYAGFALGSGRPFCPDGYSPRLPRLPIRPAH